MFAQYAPDVKAIIAYLKQVNVKVNKETVNETLQSHPDWPGLLCISDSLRKWNIPNAVGKIATGKIEELPTPFIAYTFNRQATLAIVTAIIGDTVELYQEHYAKKSIHKKADFSENWSGIYLISEPNEQSGEENYKENKRSVFFKTLIPFAGIAAVLLFSLLMLNTAGNSFSAIFIQYALSLTGVIVTVLLLWYEIDRNNPMLQKVCTGIAKGNCSAVLTGRQAKIFNWLSWSEVGFFYFSGSALSLLFVPNAAFIITWLNIFSLPYSLFSIYYQWRVAKQWCMFCLAVQVLLLSGTINGIANGIPGQLAFINISGCLLVFVLTALTWFTVNPYILQLQQAKSIKRQYLRIKFNSQVFETILKKQKQIVSPVQGLGIDIGDPAAATTIIKVCNPYCRPCAKAHPQIEALVEQNRNVKIKILFAVTNDENNPAVKPVRHLLAIASEGNEKKTRAALDSWYAGEKKDYEVFKMQYPLNEDPVKQDDKIDAMEKWCKATGIAFTPTIFINGYQLPGVYGIEDLQYFLLE